MILLADGFAKHGCTARYTYKPDGTFTIHVTNPKNESQTFGGVYDEDTFIDAQQQALAWADSINSWNKMYDDLFNYRKQFRCDIGGGRYMFAVCGSQNHQIILSHPEKGFVYVYPNNSVQLCLALRKFGEARDWEAIHYANVP